MPVINRQTPVANIQVPVPTPVQTKPKQATAPSVTPIQPPQPVRPHHSPVQFGGEKDQFGNHIQGVSAIILPWSPQPKQMSRSGKPKRYSGGTTEEDFHRQLDDNPNDHHTRMVFADWLQDRDDPRAEGYRALGQLQKHPYQGEEDGEYGSHWTTPANPAPSEPTDGYSVAYPVHPRLPTVWHNAIQNTHDEYDASLWWRNHNNRREADDQAALAFSNLSNDDKQRILRPKKLSRKKIVVRYPKPKLNPTQKERATKVELVVLPKGVSGKSCGSCQYAKKHGTDGLYCTNNAVHMNVKANWGCKLWDAKGVKRLRRKVVITPNVLGMKNRF